MSYNILLDTKLSTLQHWKFINCRYDNGKLISTSKIFGIEQEIILPDPTKLYFRWEYNISISNIKEIKIGIQNKDVLEINRKKPKPNKHQFISLVENAKQEKIKVHLIFESTDDVNIVEIEKPLLVDLNSIHRSTWLKPILDKTLVYLKGYTYQNEYKESELTIKNEDFKDTNIEKAKIGIIITSESKKEIDFNAKFIVGNTYLVKLDFKEINKYGNIYFKYGYLKSKIINEQVYLLFKAKENISLKLIIDVNEVLPYQVNLKHILLIDINNLNLLKEDIEYLSFLK